MQSAPDPAIEMSPPPAVPPGAPSPPPRPVTPHARRRAWGEPRVRTWWLFALGTLGVALTVGASQYAESRGNERLFVYGVPAKARVYQIQTPMALVQAGVGRDGFAAEPDDHPRVFLEIQGLNNPDGSPRKLTGYLPFQKRAVHPNDVIPIRYDPDNPDRWTDRTDPISYTHDLFLPLLLLPCAALFVLLALWQRGRVLRLWQTGDARRVVVTRVSHSPVAPLSRLAHCALLDGRDKRVIPVLIPTRSAAPRVGDELWVVTAPNDASRALPAVAYE